MFAISFAIVFQCFPIEKTWEPLREGTCIDWRVLFVTSSSINILMDLLVLDLSLKIFMNLKIPKQTKIVLIVAFVGIIRLSLLIQGPFMLTHLPDPTANISFVTSAVEKNLFLITASALALRPLLRTRLPTTIRRRKEWAQWPFRTEDYWHHCRTDKTDTDEEPNGVEKPEPNT
ncbi:hypothetical protein BJ170DRAFT_721270 [Xylariales sp. AK1849]|nr:hypothetical protein BJ170DRAFT_721270 [Xylariales sp. AK1849]